MATTPDELFALMEAHMAEPSSPPPPQKKRQKPSSPKNAKPSAPPKPKKPKTSTKKKKKKEINVQDISPGVMETRKQLGLTEDVIHTIVDGVVTGAKWISQNLVRGTIVISNEKVYRWSTKDIAWEIIRSGFGRLYGDLLWDELRLDCGPISKAVSLWKYSKTQLSQKKEEFDDQIDRSSPNLLPISDGKCIDLKTCTVVPRTKEHMFSYNLDVEYIPENERDPKLVADLRKILDQIGAQAKRLGRVHATHFRV